jgi:magnesium-transporting ATPase (P-type)
LGYLLVDNKPYQSEVINNYNQSNGLRAVIVGIAYTIMGLSGIVLWLGGIGIHLWTAIIAFVYGGFISAFITFMLPVVGEAFWAWKSYVYSGYFWNSYIFILVLYLAVWILVLFSSFILSVYSDN